MGAYILRRVLLMIPTLLGIMAISFVVIQFAPGGPVEQVIARLTGQAGGDPLTSGGGDLLGGQDNLGGSETTSRYRGAQGLVLKSNCIDPGERPSEPACSSRVVFE